MVLRNFDEWLNTMTDSVASWTYYTDFEKVYENVNDIKIPLCLLNSLIGSKNIKQDFLKLYNEYPEVLRAVPIIIAKRLKDIVVVKDPEKDFYFDFRKHDYTPEEYSLFMEKTGIYDLLEHHLVASLLDYVTGVEVGMDTNGRKNRTGHSMEAIVQQYLDRKSVV